MPEQKETIRPTRSEQHVQESLFTIDGESAEAAREEEERKRQQEKADILAKQKAEKEAQRAAEEAKIAAAELERKRKVECEELIQEAVRLKNSKEYKSALKKLEKAKKMGITDKEETISAIEKEIQKEKSENSFWGTLSKKVGDMVNSVLDEDK